MSRNTFPAFTILSAELATYTAEVNAARTDMLSRQLAARDLDAVPSRGAYKGHAEASFVVLSDDGSYELDLVLSLAKRYGQESVLHVDGHRGATLIYVSSGDRIPLGTFRGVAEADALAGEAYTELNGQYYAVA